MNKKFKLLGFFLCLSVALTIFLTTKVSAANNYGSGDVTLALEFNDNDNGYTINSVTVNGYNWTDGADRFSTSDGKYTIVVKVTAEEGKRPRIQWGGNWNGILSSDTTVDDNLYTITITANDVRNSVEGDGDHNNPFMGLSIKDEGNQPGPGGDPAPRFDGKAYLIWSCENGGICFHHFDNIPDFDDGNSTFYKESDIKDDNTNEQFKISAAYKGWSTDAKFNNWVEAYKTYKNIEGDIDWKTVNPKDMLGEPIDMRQYERDAIQNGCTRDNTPQDEFEHCVDMYVASLGVWNSRAQLQPVGEPDEKNAYVSYGDRNFKVIIYNDEYKGVSIGKLDDLHYYPGEWANPFIRRDQYDVSETTKNRPAKISTILLENTVNIKPLNYNGYRITALEALDVPEGAVTTRQVDGEWKIVFSSNYYDNVVFKATDNNGGVEYFEIKRFTIDAWIKWVDNKPAINADFYFAENKSYTDFDLTAKIIYKDGSEKNVTLTPHKGIDDGLGNITDEYEVNESLFGGRGLKRATFIYNLSDGEDRRIQDIYLYAEYKGSTDTSYAGAFAGSGDGVLANIYHGEED